MLMRAAEAAVISLLDVEARLERYALEGRANCLTSNPERPRRQRYRALPSPRNWMVPIDRAVTIDATGARAIETIKCGTKTAIPTEGLGVLDLGRPRGGLPFSIAKTAQAEIDGQDASGLVLVRHLDRMPAGAATTRPERVMPRRSSCERILPTRTSIRRSRC